MPRPPHETGADDVPGPVEHGREEGDRCSLPGAAEPGKLPNEGRREVQPANIVADLVPKSGQMSVVATGERVRARSGSVSRRSLATSA